jgi:hypothetical protein
MDDAGVRTEIRWRSKRLAAFDRARGALPRGAVIKTLCDMYVAAREAHGAVALELVPALAEPPGVTIPAVPKRVLKVSLSAEDQRKVDEVLAG